MPPQVRVNPRHIRSISPIACRACYRCFRRIWKPTCAHRRRLFGYAAKRAKSHSKPRYQGLAQANTATNKPEHHLRASTKKDRTGWPTVKTGPDPLAISIGDRQVSKRRVCINQYVVVIARLKRLQVLRRAPLDAAISV